MSNKLNLSDYYLDLDKIKNLSSEDERSRIHSYYIDMLSNNHEMRYEFANSIFNTLLMGGYLKDKTQEDRDEKIGTLING